VGIDRSRTLRLIFNGHNGIPQTLSFYNKDQYSFLPANQDMWASGGLFDFDGYMVYVLDFKRDEGGRIDGLSWSWDNKHKPTFFGRTT
jgi:hypothetical protein